MKKAFVLGMVVLSMSAAQFSFAAAVAAKAPRELMVDYVKQSREALFGKSGSSKGVSEAVLLNAKKAVIRDLDVPGLTGPKAMRALLNSMSGEAGKARMDALIAIVAVKKLKANLEGVDAAEAKSIDAAANASAKLLADAYLIGAKKEVAGMEAKELTLTTEALNKLTSMPADIILQFSRTERDAYTAVLEKYNLLKELPQNVTKTREELFVDAIMDAQKIDRAAALEKVQKLKECV